MRIAKSDCCAVVVDIQERLFPHIDENIELENNVVRLLNGLQILDVPILLSQQYTKGLGPTISAVTETLGTFGHIEKMSFSCYGEPAFVQALEKLERRSVILMGIETHVCVQQSALDLLAAGYRPIVMADCVSSRRHSDKVTAIERMRSAGCTITSYEAILFELCVTPGTDTFKQISRLVK